MAAMTSNANHQYVKILEKMIRSKYRRANPKNPVFSILRRFTVKCINVFALSLCLIVCLIYARVHCCMKSAHQHNYAFLNSAK